MAGEKAMPSAAPGSIRCASALTKCAPLASEQRVDQQESGDRRDGEPRTKLTDEWQHRQQHAEQQNEQQRPEEFRHRKQDGGAEIAQCLGRAAALVEQQQAAGKAEYAGDQHRAEGELDGGRQRCRDQLCGVAAQLDRSAEVTVQHIAQPDRVLRWQRLVEAHLAAFGLDVLDRGVGWHRHCRGIDRQEPQRDKQQDGDGQQDRYRGQCAPEQQQ